MYSVLPIQNKDEQEKACAVCKVAYDADLLAYKITDGEKLVGISQFRMTREGGVIVNLSGLPGSDCFEYMFMLGRGTLNFMDLCGAEFGFLDDPTVDETIAKAIGFSRDENGRFRMNIKGFFVEPCKHDKK